MQHPPIKSQAPDSGKNPNSGTNIHPRLQTHLEHLGVASRRQSAKIIESGSVKVNGKTITEPGYRLQDPENDVVTIDGRTLPPISQKPKTRTIMMYKPRGLICSADDSQGDTIFECLRDIKERIVPVGRLDKDSEGLLLLSNDGDLINTLTHPKFGHSKEYIVTVQGHFDEYMLEFLRSPMKMDGYKIRPVDVEYIKRLNDRHHTPRHMLKFVLSEGRNRQIRNMCEMAELRIEKLMRTAINDLRLPRDLKPGQWRDLGNTEQILC